jgi:C4-dicarboxylate-specific signal transduction histidine kinase
MHAVSQPLTILRASLGTSHMVRHSVEDLRKLLRRSSREVERLCVLFNYLQQFVAVESTKAEPGVEELPGLLSHTIEGVDLLFANAGVALTFRPTEEATPCVLVDSSRLEQALCDILLVVLISADRGDNVVVSTVVRDSSVEILVEPVLPASADMIAETRLRMALAEANLRSQSAQMTWKENPLAVLITLPVADIPVSA